MPRLLVFSDLHNDLRALENLMATPADYYVAAGDLVNWGRGLDKMAEPMLPKAGRVYVLPGNHESAEDIERFCSQHGFHNLHGKVAELEGGVKLGGLGYSTTTPFDTPGEFTENQMIQHLAPLADQKLKFLVCHAPPLDTDLDRIKDGLHGGSWAVRQFIEATQPDHFLCGHIHEAEGVVVQLGQTRCQNVGKKGALIEWE